MNINIEKTLAKLQNDCLNNGRSQTGYKIPLYLDRTIETLRARYDTKFYVMHSSLLDIGLRYLAGVSDSKLMKLVIEFHNEDKSKIYIKSYSLSTTVLEKLHIFKSKSIVKTNIEAHYIALKCGIEILLKNK
jgi:hypothetical protein